MPEHGLFECCHEAEQLQPRHEVSSSSSAWGLTVVAGHQPRLGCRSVSLSDTRRGNGQEWAEGHSREKLVCTATTTYGHVTTLVGLITLVGKGSVNAYLKLAVCFYLQRSFQPVVAFEVD